MAESVHTTSRRGFLGYAAAAPLFGCAAVPQAFATGPAPMKLLEGYSEWLFYERRLLAMEMYPDYPKAEWSVPMTGVGAGLHFRNRYPEQLWSDLPQPSTRAALVMRTVGALDAQGRDWNPERHG